MNAPRATVAAPAPDGADHITVAQPPLSSGSDAAFTQWASVRATDGSVLLTACVSTPIPGWVDDMHGAVSARGRGVAAAAVERAAGGPVELRGDEPLVVFAAGTNHAIGVARVFLGFDDGAVATCFAACVASREPTRADAADLEATSRACDASVVGARLEGSVRAPEPGVLLGAASWAVHHPRHAASSTGALLALAAVATLVTRPKTRSRIGVR